MVVPSIEFLSKAQAADYVGKKLRGRPYSVRQFDRLRRQYPMLPIKSFRGSVAFVKPDLDDWVTLILLNEQPDLFGYNDRTDDT